MQIVLELYNQLDSKFDETETSIKECVSAINPPMLSVPGISVESAAIILAEFGDFTKFKSISNAFICRIRIRIFSIRNI